MVEKQLPFSDTEYARRWALARALFAEHGVELAVLHDADTIFWLTGFSGTPTTWQALAVPRDGAAVHVLRYAEEATARSSSWMEDAVFWNDHEDPTAVFAAVARRIAPGARRVAVEKRSPFLSVARYEALQSALDGPECLDISDALGALRLVKSEEEVAIFRRACRAIEAGLAAGIDAAVEGASERDVAAAVAPALIRAGCDTPLVGVIGSGERLGQVHGGLSDRRLARGDLMRLEMSNAVNRHWARIMRMLSIGPPPAEVLEGYEQLRAAQDAQLALLRPGAIPEELDSMVRERLPRDGWAMQLSGYALAFHERSVIGGEADRYTLRRGERRPLQAGMVLHVYLTVGDLSISETVHVAADGAERLTTYPREWVVR